MEKINLDLKGAFIYLPLFAEVKKELDKFDNELKKHDIFLTIENGYCIQGQYVEGEEIPDKAYYKFAKKWIDKMQKKFLTNKPL